MVSDIWNVEAVASPPSQTPQPLSPEASSLEPQFEAAFEQPQRSDSSYTFEQNETVEVIFLLWPADSIAASSSPTLSEAVSEDSFDDAYVLLRRVILDKLPRKIQSDWLLCQLRSLCPTNGAHLKTRQKSLLMQAQRLPQRPCNRVLRVLLLGCHQLWLQVKEKQRLRACLAPLSLIHSELHRQTLQRQ